MAEALSTTTAPAPPVHVAIIMDGNGRWARARGLPRTAGHRRGAEAVRRTVEAAIEFGVRYLTLYGFSSENWKRPITEVDDLMGLLRRYLQSEVAELHRNGVRLHVIGDRTRLPRDIVRLIEDSERTTQANDRLDFTLALSYGGRQEIVTAAQRLAAAVAAGRLAPDDIDEARFAEQLSTAATPYPDVVIRTSGEQRISNFLLWQSAYSELLFVERLWPDFDRDAFGEAIREYQSRDRRYGAAFGRR